MTCCAPPRLESIPPAADADPAIAGTGSRSEYAFFKAAKTLIGTTDPQIPDDGEGPRRQVNLGPFALECETVTNARFEQFVRATGYVTEAERFGWSAVFRGLISNQASIVNSAVGLPWWTRVDGADWAHPEGPGSALDGREDHPVVQISWTDARAFAMWVGGRLPVEAEWEHAARGGLNDPKFPWGDEEPTDDQPLCNIWQGTFPDRNDVTDGYYGTSPVRAFSPNGAGLFGMSGNVWEWTADPFRIRSVARAAKARNEMAARDNLKILKGGSFLCHKSYCYRYRIAARSNLPPDSGASNVGFRIAYDA